MTIEKLDAHHHFWRYTPDQYPWINERMGVLRRDFLPPDLKPLIDQAGISGVVSVQARQSLQETWDLLRFAEANDWIRGVVGWLPLVNPDINRLLPTVAEHPRLCAIRHVLHDESDPMYMLREDFNWGVASLKPFSLTYDILIFERHLPQTIQFVDRHPQQIFVVDHVAKPRIRDGILSPWRENISELAKRQNVFCKISGMVTEADWSEWTSTQLRTYVEVVLAAFSPRRLMFGSDWPVCLVASTYQRWVNFVAGVVSGLSADEQARIWSGTAKEAYRLEIKRSSRWAPPEK